MSRDDESNSCLDGFNIGVDIIEIDRFRNQSLDSPFIKRNFTSKEIDYCSGYSDPAPHLAVNFAGKEAVYKSLNAVCELPLSSIEILRAPNGAPFVVLNSHCQIEVRVSLAHSTKLAVAVAIAFDPASGISEEMVSEQLDKVVSELVPGE